MKRALVLAALLFAPLAARAQTPAPADAGQEQARAHFKRGIDLYDHGDHAGALEEFRAAYAAKPSPTIKRNIALCLRALGRYAEATDALEEMLAEGDATLKPDVKEGARRAIAEMSGQIATARVRVVYGGRAAPPNVALTVDDREIPSAKIGSPLHLAPGDHVFRARATGFFDGQQRAKIAAGTSADVELALVAVEIAARGRLAIRTNVQSSTVAIDGTGVGTGEWVGDLPAGHHRIEVTAAGYRTHSAEIDVAPDQPRDLTIDMTSAQEPGVPPAYEMSPQAERAQRKWYLMGGLSLYGETLTFGQALYAPNLTRHDVGGGGIIAHGGRHLNPYMSFGILGEVGGMVASQYDNVENNAERVKVTIVTWALAPELRFNTKGNLRAIGGVAFGLEGVSVKADLSAAGTSSSTAGGSTPVTGSGTSGMGMIEGGGQLELGRLLFEATVFLDVHGVGSASGETGRLFGDSPAARAGLRALVGYTF
jgi:hypothetical protein